MTLVSAFGFGFRLGDAVVLVFLGVLSLWGCACFTSLCLWLCGCIVCVAFVFLVWFWFVCGWELVWFVAWIWFPGCLLVDIRGLVALLVMVAFDFVVFGLLLIVNMFVGRRGL